MNPTWSEVARHMNLNGCFILSTVKIDHYQLPAGNQIVYGYREDFTLQSNSMQNDKTERTQERVFSRQSRARAGVG